MEDKITYADIKKYEKLFIMAPPFLLKRFARKNTNLVSKFKPQIEERLKNLSDAEKEKLDQILNTETDELQKIMADAYEKSHIKQYKIFADPKNKQFIESNMKEIEKLI